jgi:hypothetical protein
LINAKRTSKFSGKALFNSGLGAESFIKWNQEKRRTFARLGLQFQPVNAP